MYQFKRNLILDNISGVDKEDVIRQIGSKFVIHGVSNEDYIYEVLKREVVYPTGLETRYEVIAIPHATSENIYSNEIAVARLANRVDFKSMEDIDKSIPVKFVFLIGIKEDSQQTVMLRMLMKLFMNESLMLQLIEASNEDEMFSVLDNIGGKI